MSDVEKLTPKESSILISFLENRIDKIQQNSELDSLEKEALIDSYKRTIKKIKSFTANQLDIEKILNQQREKRRAKEQNEKREQDRKAQALRDKRAKLKTPIFPAENSDNPPSEKGYGFVRDAIEKYFKTHPTTLISSVELANELKLKYYSVYNALVKLQEANKLQYTTSGLWGSFKPNLEGQPNGAKPNTSQ